MCRAHLQQLVLRLSHTEVNTVAGKPPLIVLRMMSLSLPEFTPCQRQVLPPKLCCFFQKTLMNQPKLDSESKEIKSNQQQYKNVITGFHVKVKRKCPLIVQQTHIVALICGI